MTMKLSAKGAAFVRAHEGFVGRWYADPVGIMTIGCGFTWRSAAFRQWWAKNKPGIPKYQGRMTRAEADDALMYLFAHEYGKAVDGFLKKAVPQHVYDAMCSVSFNCGPGSLKWKWAAALKRGDYEAGAALLRTTAVTARGKRLPGLVRRRKEEALLITNGVYTGVGNVKAGPVDAMADGVLARGERGPAVAALIRDLAALGHYDGVLDDVFGRGTEAAVIAFQNASGLKPDGMAGPATLEAIGRAKKAAANKARDQVPDEVKEVVEDAAKDNGGSTTIWSTVGGWLVSAVTALSQLDTWVAIAVIAVASGFAFWIVRERMRKSSRGKAALEAIKGIAKELG